MLKSLYYFITNHYHLDSGEEKRRVFGLHVALSIGLVYSMTNVILELLGNSSYDCAPGFVTIALIFIVGFYCLRNAHIDCAINIVYLIPFGIYFFFISKPYSILPIQSTIQQTLWVLFAGFLFLLFFSQSRKKLSIYFVISLLTLTYHLWKAERLGDATSIYWQKGELIFNPYLVLTFVFTITFLLAWKLEFDFKELKTKVSESDEQISQTFKTFQHGLLLMRINRDEMSNPISIQSIKANHAFEVLFRIGAREVRNVDADVIFPKIFRNAFDWNNFFLFSKKQNLELHIDHLNKWVTISTLRISEDKLICIAYDITEKKQDIMQLQESRKRYKVLLEAIPDLFFIIDKDGIYVDFVIKDSETFKIKSDDIIGNSIFEVGFSEKMSRKIFQCIQDAIQLDSIETIEYALEIEKGTAMFEMRIAKLDDNSVISIARDITKRKVAEIKLEEAKLKAEEADLLKSAFLANISHEIRTPMNAIIGFSRMLGSSDFDFEEKNRFLEIIIDNGKLLMEMINDMISISKIESNQVVANKNFCKINDLMVELYREYSIEVSNKPLRLKLNNENANPKFGVLTDKYLLLEILKKLIDNAIKFTASGQIEFGYKLKEKTELMFFVKDTGIGIDTLHMERIFDRFHQIDNTKTRKYEGTGLGLAIAQHYTILLGGNIQVNSKVDIGSEFYFSIPFEGGDGTLKIIR